MLNESMGDSLPRNAPEPTVTLAEACAKPVVPEVSLIFGNQVARREFEQTYDTKIDDHAQTDVWRKKHIEDRQSYKSFSTRKSKHQSTCFPEYRKNSPLPINSQINTKFPLPSNSQGAYKKTAYSSNAIVSLDHNQETHAKVTDNVTRRLPHTFSSLMSDEAQLSSTKQGEIDNFAQIQNCPMFEYVEHRISSMKEEISNLRIEMMMMKETQNNILNAVLRIETKLKPPVTNSFKSVQCNLSQEITPPLRIEPGSARALDGYLQSVGFADLPAHSEQNLNPLERPSKELSIAMNALTLKYCPDKIKNIDLTTQENNTDNMPVYSTDMSFASVEYLQKYGLIKKNIQEKNVIPNPSEEDKLKENKFLDVTAIKKQPKLL